MNTDLSRLLAEVDAILLDFDGPVCSVFSGCPAPQVAAELVTVLLREGIDVPPSLNAEPDPLKVLRWAGSATDQAVTLAVEDALCAAERRAVESAAPTPYGRAVIVAAHHAGFPVAVVSNNSAGAVTNYLAAHRLGHFVSSTVGRAYGKPQLMKPNPAPILQAARAVGARPSRSVLVGDSLSDIEAARAAGARAIAYANRPPKLGAFQRAGADVLITSMGTLADALLARLGE
jgi:phosphoglycolate phosphatase-like HAD superfamily hydrolase